MKSLIKIFIFLFLGNLYASDFKDEFIAGSKKSKTKLSSQYGEMLKNSVEPQLLLKTLQTEILPDELSKSRGVSDAALYKKWSPSVVLIVTDDGLGSGAVISNDGKIITNLHVVGNNQNVGVIFKPTQEGKEVYREDAKIAKVIRADALTDLAILKIDSIPSNIIPIKLGSETDIGVGLDVHAIGHPKGNAWSYTKGVVSQFRPDYSWSTSVSEKHKASVIQTQTPINPGNSGGPLILSNGLLIGVNSFKSTDSESLNFAVSVEEVKKLLNSSKDKYIAKIDKAKCEPKTIYEGRNEKNNADIVQLDTKCTGKMNLVFAMPDDTSKPLIMFLHSKSERIPNAMVLSYKRDFKFWDLSFWDERLTETWTMVGLHKNGDAAPYKIISRDEYEKSFNK
jgi:S1-C subfamily serine protease